MQSVTTSPVLPYWCMLFDPVVACQKDWLNTLSVWKERRNLISSTERGVSLMWSFCDCQIDANETLIPNKSLARFASFPVTVCNTTANASLYRRCLCLSADHSGITEEQRERNQKLADETCNLHFDTSITKFHRCEKSAASSSRSLQNTQAWN